MGRYGAQTGRSSFQVTLRPRLVMRRAARGTVAEIRPHVPYGVLRLTAPPGLRARIPATVVIGRDGRVALPVRPRQAERLRATLIGRGPAPPVGLRG
jgi:hypothetical protein